MKYLYYFKNQWKKFKRFMWHVERIIRRVFGIKPRNPFMNLKPLLDKAIEENYQKLKKQGLVK